MLNPFTDDLVRARSLLIPYPKYSNHFSLYLLILVRFTGFTVYTVAMLSTIAFAAATVFPIFALIALGAYFRKKGIIGPEFIANGSKIVFRFALPASVFLKMSAVRSVPSELLGATAIFVVVAVIIYIALWFLFSKLPVQQHGSFVQGAFRGNITIIGLAVIENSFGLEALQVAVVILVVIMPLNNFLSIITLSRSSAQPGEHPLRRVFFEVVKNPLIWAIAVGLPFGLLEIPYPQVIGSSLEYLAKLTMPLALISIGGSLSLRGLVKRRFLWTTASVVKLLIFPALVWGGAWFFGLSGNILAALVLTSACPTAVSSFAMADAMGADSELSGEIVSATTLFSIATFTFWIVLLIKYSGLLGVVQ